MNSQIIPLGEGLLRTRISSYNMHDNIVVSNDTGRGKRCNIHLIHRNVDGTDCFPTFSNELIYIQWSRYKKREESTQNPILINHI